VKFVKIYIFHISFPYQQMVKGLMSKTSKSLIFPYSHYLSLYINATVKKTMMFQLFTMLN